MADTNFKELVVKLLGLEAAASDESILNAANTFQADMVAFKASQDERVAAAEALANTATEKADKIANEAKAMAEELVAYDLEKYGAVINDAEAIKSQLLSNRSGTIAILKNIKITNSAAKPVRTQPLHDPKNVGQPKDTINNSGAPKVDPEVASRISNRAREISNTLHISHQQAWSMAKSEVLSNAK